MTSLYGLCDIRVNRVSMASLKNMGIYIIYLIKPDKTGFVLVYWASVTTKSSYVFIHKFIYINYTVYVNSLACIVSHHCHGLVLRNALHTCFVKKY